MAELADALDLGSSGRPWGFKSLYAHPQVTDWMILIKPVRNFQSCRRGGMAGRARLKIEFERVEVRVLSPVSQGSNTKSLTIVRLFLLSQQSVFLRELLNDLIDFRNMLIIFRLQASHPEPQSPIDVAMLLKQLFGRRTFGKKPETTERLHAHLQSLRQGSPSSR